MTAEIVIMNREAIALAADSAVSIAHGDSQKIFSSANKLFALSNTAPVGILVYGNAYFMGIPWETIIKEYRYQLGDTAYNSLEEYYSGFCNFLQDETSRQISEDLKTNFVRQMIRSVFREIEREVTDLTQEMMFKESEETGVVDFNDVGELEKKNRDEIVEKYASRSRDIENVIRLSNEFKKTVQNHIKELKQQVFEDTLSSGTSQKLTTIGLKTMECFISDLLGSPSTKTGIAIAGFGDKEFFPTISRFSVEGIIDGQLKMREDVETKTLDPQNSSLIVSLAQTDMVRQFMEGISPGHLEYLRERIFTAVDNYASSISDVVTQLTRTDSRKLYDKLHKDLSKESESILEDIESYSDEEFASPIVRVVEFLPKEQLADMAESLVSLTALKRRVSDEEETVGGPIDVAIITKGEGLIWIKRKHYFDPGINPSYFEKLAYRRTHYDSKRSVNNDND